MPAVLTAAHDASDIIAGHGNLGHSGAPWGIPVAVGPADGETDGIATVLGCRECNESRGWRDLAAIASSRR